MLNTDIVIIGAGVSGMTSALYLKRANKNIIIIDNNAPGGQLLNIPLIENYPGIPEISGVDLATNIYLQIQKLDIDYHYGNVLEIKRENDSVIVTTDMETIKCNKVIIASGRRARKLGLDNENKLLGRGISYCALCDGNFFKDKEVAVIGGADSALSESLYLSNICKIVYIIYRKDKFRAQEYLIDRVNNKDNIIPIFNSNVLNIIGNEKLEGIVHNHGTLRVDGLFIYIGFIPNSDFIDCDKDNGYIKVNNDYETTVPGVYAIGDVILKSTYQIGTCVGEAIDCANKIINKK